MTLGRCAIVNRMQALVLGFFLVAWVSLVVILAAAPEVYDQALMLSPGRRWWTDAFLIALSAFIALLSIGVMRRWRWTFWLILVAFLSGVLRVPVAVLQHTGVLTMKVSDLHQHELFTAQAEGTLDEAGDGMNWHPGRRPSGLRGPAPGRHPHQRDLTAALPEGADPATTPVSD